MLEIPFFDTLIESFYHWEKTTPNNIFLRQPYGTTWKNITYAEAGQEVRKMTNALSALGLQKGDHIAICSKNCYHWILADLAIMMGGFVSVPLYATLPKKKLQEVLEKSDSKAIFAGKLEQWGDKAQAIPKGVHLIRFPHYKGNAQVTEGLAWDDLIAENKPQSTNYIPDPNSLWTILFTSGTTGTPKGVMHLHRTPINILKTEYESSWIGVFTTKKQKYFSFLPLNHVAERIGVATPALLSGGILSFAENIDTFIKNLQDTQPTTIFAVPRIWTKFYLGVINKMPQKRLDFLLKIPLVSTFIKKKLLTALGLRDANIVATGAAITPAYLKDWYKKLGIHLIEAYGMTEVCGSMTNGPMLDCPPDSVGKVIPNGAIKIDPETGEILMKSPFMMEGYYKDQALTDAVLVDGWMHSGDRGTIDENGFLRVIGRMKDAFKTSKGQFITPNPMEEMLGENDYIEQVCVVGLGISQPIALVNLSELGQNESSEILNQSLQKSIETINADLANYQKISTIVITKEIWSEENDLLTPTLKIRRGKINEKYQSQYIHWHEANEQIIQA